MSSAAVRGDLSLRAPFAASAVLHVAAIAAFLFMRQSAHAVSAPVYRVNLIAAAPGPRAMGVVQPAPVEVAPVPAPPPIARAVEKHTMKVPAKAPPEARAPKIATPNATPAPAVPTAPLPTAGGGSEGGKGADVANVNTAGVVFPYPAYLEKIVRMIALNFKPSNRGALTAEVAFMIRRDGTVAGLRLTKRSAVFSFDQDALAAVELASKSFGRLPEGFSDDVLPVIFSFDPRLIR